MTTRQIFEHFGKPYPLGDPLKAFNNATVAFEEFIDRKQGLLRDYAMMPKSSPIAIEQGNYEIAKCYEFMDTFGDALMEAQVELEREALYLLYLTLFGKQKFHGRELQAEINKLKAELGL